MTNIIYINNIELTEISLYNIDKSHISLEKYPFSIVKTLRIFLIKDDHRGLKNKYEVRPAIMYKLGKSMRNIHEIMKLTKNLEKDEIYEIFNAQNVESFLVNLLND